MVRLAFRIRRCLFLTVRFAGPFFRVEQLIITSKDEGVDMLGWNMMAQVLDIQLFLENIKVSHSEQNYTLQDLCYKPIPGRTPFKGKGIYVSDQVIKS